MNFSDLKNIIPKKYLIAEELLQEFRNFIEKKMPPKKTGRPRVDNDPLIAGIYYLLKTGCQWDALPLCFGPSKTVYHRFRELVEAGAFQSIWKSTLTLYDKKTGLRLHEQSIDSSHKKAPLGGDKTGKSPVDRKKLGTKVNLAVEENGIPIGATIAGGNRHDTQLFIPLLDDLPNQVQKPDDCNCHTDKGYVSKKNRQEAINRNYKPVMPQKKPKNKPYAEPPIKDRKRWVIERTFSWLNRFRRVFVRYEKISNNFLAMVHFACLTVVFNKI